MIKLSYLSPSIGIPPTKKCHCKTILLISWRPNIYLELNAHLLSVLGWHAVLEAVTLEKKGLL